VFAVRNHRGLAGPLASWSTNQGCRRAPSYAHQALRVLYPPANGSWWQHQGDDPRGVIRLNSGQNDIFRLLVLRGPEPVYAVEPTMDLSAFEVHERHVAVTPPSHQPPVMSFGVERCRNCYTPVLATLSGGMRRRNRRVPRRCSLGRAGRERVWRSSLHPPQIHHRPM